MSSLSTTSCSLCAQIYINKVMVAWETRPIERAPTPAVTALTYHLASTVTSMTSQVKGFFELKQWHMYQAHWVILISTGKLDGQYDNPVRPLACKRGAV